MARRTKRWTVKRQRETHSKPADGKKYRTSLQALHYRNYSELGNASDARKFADGISDLLAAACDGEGGTPPPHAAEKNAISRYRTQTPGCKL